jgi:hypothetical protein
MIGVTRRREENGVDAGRRCDTDGREELFQERRARALPARHLDGWTRALSSLAGLASPRARALSYPGYKTRIFEPSKQYNVVVVLRGCRLLIVVAVVAITPPANYLLSLPPTLFRAPKSGSSQDSQDLKDFARSAGHVTFADIDKRDPTLGCVLLPFAFSFACPSWGEFAFETTESGPSLTKVWNCSRLTAQFHRVRFGSRCRGCRSQARRHRPHGCRRHGHGRRAFPFLTLSLVKPTRR